MIFVYFELLDVDAFAAVVLFGAIATALVLGISFHEASHAYVADFIGDGLPRSRGRVTLNPLAHLDPMGTALLFIVGFGWGKPVPVNPYSSSNPKVAMAVTAAAGPISNFLVAFLAGLPLQLGVVPWLPPFNVDVINSLIRGGWAAEDYVGLYLSAVVLISIILGVFNLVPLFPLDGHRVPPAFLPDAVAEDYVRFQSRYGFIILIVLIALPFLTGGQFGILFEVMSPFINFLARVFAGIDTDVFG